MILLISLIAAAAILLQGAVIWAFLKFVKSFGAYTKVQQELTSAILTTHESNLLLHRTHVQMFEELRQSHPMKKAEVA